VKFPLADWIDTHVECRHNLGTSGMVGSIRHPLPARRSIRSASPVDLCTELARSLRVDPRRMFLTHGATEGNAGVLFFLARRNHAGSRRCRVRYPEYPPLFDTARWAGFEPTDSMAPAAIGVLSQPRNPEGHLWTSSELDRWTDGVGDVVVDETFREFSGRDSIATQNRPHCWTIGSFTKFFGADDLRVGFVVTPEEDVEEYARFHGLVHDELSPYSTAGALACLHALPRIRRDVSAILQRNLAALHAELPEVLAPVAPVLFDRVPNVDGDSVARQALAASVLVCPGSYFGDRTGVRIGLTRRSFPRDFAAYMEVRERAGRSRLRRSRAAQRSGTARWPPAGTGRARAAPS